MKRYITGIDGLRTLGVLAVIFYHLTPSVVAGGYLGVLIFFVLTGYLVTDSLLREKTTSTDKKIHWKVFFAKRLKRIYPMLLFVFMGSALFFFLFQPTMLAGLRDSFLSSVLSANNWWQIINGSSYFQNFVVTANNAFKHIYFLSIEGQFYLFIFLLSPLFFKLNRIFSFVFVFLLSIASAVGMALLFNVNDPTRVYYGTDTRLFALLIGMGLAYVWRAEKAKKDISSINRMFSLPLAFLLTVALFSAFFLLPDKSKIVYYGGMYGFSLLTVLLIFLISHPALPVNRLFSNRVFSYIGSRSYGIYLWQLPVFIALENWHINTAAPYNIIWEFLLIGLLSEVSYRYIEKPFKAITWQSSKDFFTTNFVRISKIPYYALIPLALAGLIIIGTAPAQAKDIAALQKHLEQAADKTAQRNKTLEEATDKSKQSASSSSSAISSSSSVPAVSYPPAILQLAQEYGLSPTVVQNAQSIPVVAVGDSVLLDVSGSLQQIFPQMYVDGVVGRHTEDGPGVIASLPANLRTNAKAYLINLGINGDIPPADVAAIMQEAGDKPVYWVNVRVPRSWEAGDNAELAAAAKQYKNLHVLDWYGLSNNHPEYFVSDQVHLTSAGIYAYTQLVTNAIAKNP